MAVLVAGHPQAGSAQLSAPCKLTCGLVLGGSAYAVGTAGLVAYGRSVGGVSTTGQAAWIWGGGFALTLGAGFALAGNGERQERTVYASGLGLLAGGAVGLALGAIVADGDGARHLAVTLLGVGAGALLGGVIGAATYDPDGLRSESPTPLLTFRWGR